MRAYSMKSLTVEAAKFGIEAARSRDGKAHGNITITNYEQLEKFSPDDFIGVVCDESSAIKSSRRIIPQILGPGQTQATHR